jgi:hypothetical protein
MLSLGWTALGFVACLLGLITLLPDFDRFSDE